MPARAAAFAALLFWAAAAAPARAEEIPCASRVPPNVLVVLGRGASMGAPAGGGVPDLDGDGARTRYDLALGVLFRLLNADGDRVDGFATPRDPGALPRFRRLISVEDELFLSARIGLIWHGGSVPAARGAPFQVQAPPKTPNVPPYGEWSYRAMWDRAIGLGPPRSTGEMRRSASVLRTEIADYFSVAASVPSRDPFDACRPRMVLLISDGSDLDGLKEGESLLDESYGVFGLFVGVSSEVDRARLRALLAGRRAVPGEAERVVFFDGPKEVEESPVFARVAAPPSAGPWKGADPVVPAFPDLQSGRIHVAALAAGGRFPGPVTASLRSLTLSPAGSPVEAGSAGWDAAAGLAGRPGASRKILTSVDTGSDAGSAAILDAVGDEPLRALLGSTPVLVGPPSPFYFDPADPGARGAFVQAHSRRPRTLLASGDGGVLHAFDAGSWDPRSTPAGYGAGTGGEVWAYAPGFLLRERNGLPDAAALRDGYGDGSPAAADIRVEPEPGSPAAPGWRTYAFGGAGRGGRGYYALDVTDPASSAYPAPVWELGKDRAPRVGKTWSTPTIGKVRGTPGAPGGQARAGGRWVAVVGAGRGRPAGATTLLRPVDLRGREDAPGPVAVDTTGNAPQSGQIALIRTVLERRGGRWGSRTYRATATYAGRTATAFENVVFRGRPDRTTFPAGTTLVSWTDPGDEGKAILVLDASTGRVIQELTHPDMGEVVTAPTIVADGEGYIERVYTGDLAGNVWRATVEPAGTFDLGGGPFFSVAGEGYAKAIFSKVAVASGEAPYPGLWVHFGTGDRENSLDEPGGAFFAVYDDLPAGTRADAGSAARTERNLADATGFFAAIGGGSARFPALGGADAGWYAALPGRGEKVLAPPRVFHRNLFFTTFTPGEGSCPTGGAGRLYGLGAVPGKNLGNPALSGDAGAPAAAAATPSQVRMLPGGGIPSAPVISTGAGGGAVAYVGSPDGTVHAERIPAPGSSKSIRYWTDADRPESGTRR